MKGYTKIIDRRRVETCAKHVRDGVDVRSLDEDITSRFDDELGRGVMIAKNGALYLRDDMYTPDEQTIWDIVAAAIDGR